MACPRSSLPIALAALLFAGSVAAQPVPTAASPGYSPSPPPFYGPAVAPPYVAPISYPVTRLYSPAMLIVGLVTHVVGTAAAVGGSASYMNNSAKSDCVLDSDVVHCREPSHLVETFAMVAGGVAFLAGIPFIAIGARSARAMPQDASLAPRITLSPRGGSLTVQF
jgi:hypothetical protein